MQTLLTRLLPLLLLTLSAYAQAQDALVGELTAFVVSADADGIESFLSADSVVPGEIIEYRLRYTNNGDDAIRGLTVVGAIPAGVTYVADSARAGQESSLEISFDNGGSWHGEPAFITVLDASGESVRTIVPPESYTEIRWTSGEELLPQSSSLYTYRVIVTNEPNS